jgi:hypothetical protein
MGIDITLEDLIRLSEVPKLKCMPPGKNGKRIALTTVYRWALGGTGGVKLETLKVGGTLCTTVEALQRFFVALSAHRSGAGHGRAGVYAGAGGQRPLTIAHRKARPTRSRSAH